MTDERYSAVIDDYMTEVVEAHNRSTLRARQAHLDTELLPDKVSRIFLSGLDFYGKYMQRARQGLGDCLRYALSMSGNLVSNLAWNSFLSQLVFSPFVCCDSGTLAAVRRISAAHIHSGGSLCDSSLRALDRHNSPCQHSVTVG